MEALLILLPRKRSTSLVIYRHGKLTSLPCVSPSDGPQILLVPVQLNIYTSLRIAIVAPHIHNIENQYTGQEEPAGPATLVFQFSEREELTKLLFHSPDAKISYEQQIEDSCRLVRLLKSLCERRQ
jgi:hypothetical protein